MEIPMKSKLKINATNQWYYALSFAMTEGLDLTVRGRKTRELINHCSVIDMAQPIITDPLRKLGYKFMFAEAAWILSGDDRVETIKPYSKDIVNFSDDGVTFFGAYGPKIWNQMGYVMNAFRKDPYTRQAVVNIWREAPPVTKDVPCTLSVQWVIRNGYLNCIDHMRSSDLWLGHPYDIFNFSMLSLALAVQLRAYGIADVKLGYLYLNAGSKHIYEDDFEGVANILKDADELTSINPDYMPHAGLGFDPADFTHGQEVVNWLWEKATMDPTTLRRIVGCHE